MHYVKEFTINGITTRQAACIELQGRPNAATEGAVGVLGMDVTSPTHEVYKCTAVKGSVYTWELLSSGQGSDGGYNSDLALEVETLKNKVEGLDVATVDGQTVVGKYNAASDSALFIVANGTSRDARSNAFEVISDRYGCAIKVGDTALTEDDIIALQADICFQEGTTILMADGTYKAIQDVQYGDMIMTYDIDNNELVPCKSFGCLPTGFAHSWNHYCFDNGSVLKIFGGHRVYNADKQALVYFSKMEIGDHGIASNCEQTTYCYSPTKVPAAVSVRKYTIFCETGLYFANDILCGHPICQPLDFHIRTHGAVKLSDEDKAVIQAYADARDNEYLVEMQNKEYIAEALPIWKEQQTASRKIAECKDKLAKRDYKTIKAMQGKLTEEEVLENITVCDELRTTINNEELVVADFKAKIKELQEKHNVHPRPLQTIETLNVKTAIAMARKKYTTKKESEVTENDAR